MSFPQFLFHVVNLGVNVGSDVVSKILVASGGHGEGKTKEDVEKRGGGKGRVGPWNDKAKK
jgi:hypothetical protein